MLAVAGELAADDAAWAYEMKWDGLRAIATISSEKVTLYSRTGRDVTGTYPELAGLAEAVGGHDAVLDGEIVAFGGGEWPSFEALQQRMNIGAVSQAGGSRPRFPVTYLAFDLLAVDGQSLTDQPYTRRRARLDELAVDGPRWQTPPAFIGIPGADVQAVSKQHGLEGIMAKRLTSRYEAGRRSSSWRKIKNIHRQEFVVGGWKPGEGVRTDQIGSLMVGVYGPDGFTFAGHVGTGFTRRTLTMLMARLAPLRRDTSPFGATIPHDQARGAVWAEPSSSSRPSSRCWTSSGTTARRDLPGPAERQGPGRRRPRTGQVSPTRMTDRGIAEPGATTECERCTCGGCGTPASTR